MAAAKNQKPQRNCRFSSLASEYELALLKLEKQGRANAAKDRRARGAIATATTDNLATSKRASSKIQAEKVRDKPERPGKIVAGAKPWRCSQLSPRNSMSRVRKNCQGKITNLLVAWQTVVPPMMAEHTDSVVYSKRSTDVEVLVYVDDAAFAAELSMNKEIYRIKMQEATGKAIADIKFLVSRQTSLRKQKQKPQP